MSVKKALILWLLCGLLLSWHAEGQDRTIRFAGEVARGLSYRKNIGHRLDFVLTPLRGPPSGGLTGWTIQISPQDSPPDPECTDYLWVVTPPYRFWNPRYLSTEYGKTAQEAVGISLRDFNFVLNCDDFRIERKRVERVLWPPTYSKEEVDNSLAKLGTSPKGAGRLWIRDSKYTPGDKSTSPVIFGAIHWIKFEAEIKFPEDRQEQSKP